MLGEPRAAGVHGLQDSSRAKTERPDQASMPGVAHARDNVHGPSAGRRPLKSEHPFRLRRTGPLPTPTTEPTHVPQTLVPEGLKSRATLYAQGAYVPRRPKRSQLSDAELDAPDGSGEEKRCRTSPAVTGG